MCSIFCHSKDIQDAASLPMGATVSFRFEETRKGGNAKEVIIEGKAADEEEGPRETGTVKSWNAEKGFGFIGWSGEKE